MAETTWHNGLTGEELSLDQVVDLMIANSSCTPRFRAVDPASAPAPVPGMRVYGRAGRRLGVAVVHEVRDGQVYFAQRWRGIHTGYPCRGWNQLRGPVGDWAASVVHAFAIRVPREAAPCPR